MPTPGPSPTLMDMSEENGMELIGNRRTPKAIIAWRKNLAARLYLTGCYTLEDIVEYFLQQHQVKISKTQIGSYLSQMKEQWQKDAMASTNEMVTGELAKLKEIEDLIAQEYERNSISSRHFADTNLKIAKRRANLMGLDKAKKVELHDRRTSELSDEELEAIIKASKEEKEEEAE